MKNRGVIQKPIEGRILLIRGTKVLLDNDLAELYAVTVKRLNEQVKRNRERFPEDFMFRLTSAEHDSLRSQFATSNLGRGGRRYPPLVFTEHGAATQQLSCYLRAERRFPSLAQDLSGLERPTDANLALGGDYKAS